MRVYRIRATVDKPIAAIGDRIAGQESSRLRVVVGVPESLETGGIFLVAKGTGVAKKTRPSTRVRDHVANSAILSPRSALGIARDRALYVTRNTNANAKIALQQMTAGNPVTVESLPFYGCANALK